MERLRARFIERSRSTKQPSGRISLVTAYGRVLVAKHDVANTDAARQGGAHKSPSRGPMAS